MYQQSSWYDLQFSRYTVWHTEIGNYESFFAILSSPLKPQKIRILKKRKRLLEISFYKSVPKTTIIYEVQFLRYGVRQTGFFLSFQAIFCHFIPITTRKIKIFKKWKNNLDMSSFYTFIPKITIIWCMLHEIRNTTDIIFCPFEPFLALLPHYWSQK